MQSEALEMPNQSEFEYFNFINVFYIMQQCCKYKIRKIVNATMLQINIYAVFSSIAS